MFLINKFFFFYVNLLIIESNNLIFIEIRRSHKQHKTLGRIRIGPNHFHDNQHWEKMTKQHGTFVTMVHNIGDV